MDGNACAPKPMYIDSPRQLYKQKCEKVNLCFQSDITFGRYQWEILFLSGLGWLADNLWLQGVAVILPQVQQDLRPSRIEYITLSLYAGLITGAVIWGCLADNIGRKLSWQVTLLLAGIFGIASGAAQSFTVLCSLIACVGFSIGGNLPVDGALFLESIPPSHQWLLTFLSTFWSLGQLIASLIIWVFLSHFPNDKNWRYAMYTMGGLTLLMSLLRFFIFDLQESAKYLIATNQDEKAIQVLQYIANRNGKTITITLDDLIRSPDNVENSQTVLAKGSAFKISSLLSHIKPLFSTKIIGFNTAITVLIWGILGLAYPLFNGFLPLYLERRLQSSSDSLNTTYRDYTIVSICGVPGSIIACILVDRTKKTRKMDLGGRKMALSIFTFLTGLFLFLFTQAKDEASSLGYSCVTSLTQNAMYGVLYAYTPEVFPAPHRGTGDALCSAFNRMMGILAPVIKILTSTQNDSTSKIGPNIPVFVSASLFLFSAVLSMLLPIETAGKAAL